MNAFSHGTISHGTLRPQDLLVSFAEAYEQHWNCGIGYFDKSLFVCCKALALYLDNSSNPTPDEYEVAGEFLDEIIQKLEEIAAQHDSYFGTTEGDGSDFGFWPNDGGEADDDWSGEVDGMGNPLDGGPIPYTSEEVEEIKAAHDKLHQEFQTDGKFADREADQATDGKTIRGWGEIEANLMNIAEDLRIEQILKDSGVTK